MQRHRGEGGNKHGVRKNALSKSEELPSPSEITKSGGAGEEDPYQRTPLPNLRKAEEGRTLVEIGGSIVEGKKIT